MTPIVDKTSLLKAMGKPAIFRWLVLGLMAIWAVASIVIVFINTLSPSGANDLYTYWFAGHFVRQGDDPYRAYLEKQVPNLPVTYLDEDATQLVEIIQPGLVPAPGYTYPFLLFFTLFAFLSWETAKWAWLLVNLVCAVLVPVLALRLLPAKMRFPGWLSLGIGLSFFGLSATRFALSSGQVTFLVLDLMITAVLLAPRKPWLAGLLLGLALSKYSVSTGFLIFFILLKPDFRIALTAITVQAGGILALMGMSGSSFNQVLNGYTLMFEHHAPMDGIHLASLIPINNLSFDLLVAILLSIATLLPLWLRRKVVETPQGYLSGLSALMAWSMLVAYHRAYDAVSVIILMVLTASVLFQSQQWELSSRALNFWRSISLVELALLLLPAGSMLRSITTAEAGWLWVFIAGRLPTLALLTGLCGSLWLYFRFAKNQPSVSQMELT